MNGRLATRTRTSRDWLAVGMLVGLALLVVAAVLPPFLPEGWRTALMAAFGPVCHQLPARSPHIDGVPIAICDRCSGIYGGLLLGGLLTWGWKATWRGFEDAGRYVLLGALVPLGVDWMGPIVGLWTNTPVSRALTGLFFGLVAGAFVMDRLLRRPTSAKTLSVQQSDT